MRENEKQIFTRREIEKDIRSAYKSFSLFGAVVLASLLIVDCIFFALEVGKEHSSWFVLIIVRIFSGALFLFQFLLLIAVIYSLYKYWSSLKYEIVIDNFEFFHTKRYYPIGGFRAFHFKTYGDFLPSFSLGVTVKEYEKGFYSWSSKCECGYNGLMQSTYPGDEFYLIIINNKIKYVYNKKIFEFKEKA